MPPSADATPGSTAEPGADEGAPSVLGGGPRSIFDALRPSRVELAGRRLGHPGGMALAALQQPEVTGGVGRPSDTVVVAGRWAGVVPAGWVVVDVEGRGPGIACGLAIGRRRRVPAARTWCLLRTVALADGRALEALSVLGDLPSAGLVPVVVGARSDAARAAGVLAALGMQVAEADNDDAWSVLSALDRVGRAVDAAGAVGAVGAAGAVVAGYGAPS